MSDLSGTATVDGQPQAAEPRTAWTRFLDRFLPVSERWAALWIVGAAALLGSIRALTYPTLLRFVDAHVYSPGAEELGFPLRATAIADVLWGAFACVFILVLLRYTKAPKATALYIALSGFLAAFVLLGNRLALNAVMALAGSDYQRALWSDMQPMMLAATEAVGVVVGAWLAQLMSGEERPADGGTLLPAMGWSGPPLEGATRLAVAYVAVRAVTQLAVVLVMFGPLALSAYQTARHILPHNGVQWPSLFSQLAVVAVYFLAAYLAVKRFRGPVTVWLAFFAAGIPGYISALIFLPTQLRVLAQGGGQAAMGAYVMGGFTLVAWPLGALPGLLGVWLATRPARASGASATLPAQDHDHS